MSPICKSSTEQDKNLVTTGSCNACNTSVCSPNKPGVPGLAGPAAGPALLVLLPPNSPSNPLLLLLVPGLAVPAPVLPTPALDKSTKLPITADADANPPPLAPTNAENSPVGDVAARRAATAAALLLPPSDDSVPNTSASSDDGAGDGEALTPITPLIDGTCTLLFRPPAPVPGGGGV